MRARAATGATFALARIRFAGNAPWTKVLPALARDLPAPHVFANYGPKDYEILLIDMKEGEAERMVEKLVDACTKARAGHAHGAGLVPPAWPFGGCAAGARERGAEGGRRLERSRQERAARRRRRPGCSGSATWRRARRRRASTC